MMTTTTLASVLTWLLQTSIKGSVMIVVVAALIALIGRYTDARWRHLLWVIVLVRLAMPAAPESRWSLFNLLPGGDHVIRSAGSVEVGQVALRRSAAASTPAEVVSVRQSPILVFARWIAALWLLGAIALMLRTLISSLRVSRAVRAALKSRPADPRLLQLLDEGRSRLGIGRNVRIVETDVVRTPALHGVFRPVLLLPAHLASSFSIEELRHVILHELWHLRRMDVAVSWALSAVQALHWFNPLVWFAASRIKEERELACDELALSCLEREERFGYGRTILKLLESFRAAAPVPALVGIVNGKQKMKRRLTMIASFRNRTRFSILFLLVVSAVGAAALTDAPATAHKMIMRHADPASLPTIEKLGQRVTFETTNASFADLLNAVSNATGVVVTQSPEIASLPVQQARFTIKADNVPAHAVLMQALMPFELNPEPDASGVTVKKAESCATGMMKHEAMTESEADGKKTVQHMIVMTGGSSAEAGHQMEMKHEAGTMKHEISIRATGDGKSCTFDENGKLHNELTLNISENGVESTGKLTVDISKQ